VAKSGGRGLKSLKALEIEKWGKRLKLSSLTEVYAYASKQLLTTGHVKYYGP